MLTKCFSLSIRGAILNSSWGMNFATFIIKLCKGTISDYLEGKINYILKIDQLFNHKSKFFRIVRQISAFSVLVKLLITCLGGGLVEKMGIKLNHISLIAFRGRQNKFAKFWGWGGIEIVTTPTQPQLNSKVGCDAKMTLHHPSPTPTTQTQCPPYLSCSGPDFNQTLKIGLQDQQHQ